MYPSEPDKCRRGRGWPPCAALTGRFRDVLSSVEVSNAFE